MTLVPRQQLGIVAAQVALDADEGNAVQREQRLKQLEIDRTIAVIGVTRMAGPGKSDAFARQRLDRRPPFCDVRIVRAQIGNIGGDRSRVRSSAPAAGCRAGNSTS